MNIVKDLKKGQRIKHNRYWWLVEKVYLDKWSGTPRAVLRREGVIKLDTDQIYVESQRSGK